MRELSHTKTTSMTPPRIYTAKRRSLHNHHDVSQTISENLSITVPSDYGSEVEIDTELLAVSVEAVRKKEGDGFSDYGSDFDCEGEAILEDLLGSIEVRPWADREDEEEGDGRGVAFLSAGSRRRRRRRESSGTTGTFFSCEERVCGSTREAKEDGGEGGGKQLARKSVCGGGGG